MTDKIEFINRDPKIYMELNDVLDISALRTSSWYQNLDSFVHPDIKSFKDFLKNLDRFFRFPKYTTAKACPGIGQLMKNSVVVKSPIDFCFKVKQEHQDGEDILRFVYYYSDSDMKDYCVNHFDFQYKSKDGYMDDYFNIKIQLPVDMASNDSQMILVEPLYHKVNEFRTLPGVITLNKTYSQSQVNVNTMWHFPKGTQEKEYLIKAGTPLAYMYFPNGVRVKDRVTNMNKKVPGGHNLIKKFSGGKF